MSSTLGIVGFVWDRWVHCGASFGVVGFVRCRWVHLDVPWESLGSFGVARVIGVLPGGLFRSASMGSLESALGIAGFVRGRYVHCVAPWGSSGSFGIAEFIVVRPGGRRVRLVHWVRPGSLLDRSGGLTGCALRIAGFFLCRWVHWVAHWLSSGLFGVTGFIGKRPGCRRVRSGLWIHLVRSGSLGSLVCALECSGRLGLLGYALRVVGFVRDRWVNWGAPWVSLWRAL